MKNFLWSAVTLAAVSACSSPQEPAKSDAGVESCPTELTGPTVHEGEIKADEVWSAKAGPHIVKSTVHVIEGAKLTIEPCATVKLARDADLEVAHPYTPNRGELVAVGTESKPIRFERLEDGAWGRLFIYHPGRARLAYVTLEGGGGSTAEYGETIAYTGDGSLPSKHGLFVDHVTVTQSRGLGVHVYGGGAFETGSNALTIRASGDVGNPYPLMIGELAIDSVPTGTYTGNKVDEIVVRPETVSGAGGLQESATMHERGVPYRIGLTPNLDNLFIGRGSGSATPTLTIEAGITLKMVKGVAIELDGSNGAPAVIKALGTKEKPVVFTSAESTKSPGDWRGFYFNGHVSADNVLSNVRIEYTGADCLCSLVTCSKGVSEYEAALIFGERPAKMFLENSVIAHASGHAIVQGWDGTPLDWKASNTFDDVAGCIATLPRNADTSCPESAPACR